MAFEDGLAVTPLEDSVCGPDVEELVNVAFRSMHPLENKLCKCKCWAVFEWRPGCTVVVIVLFHRQRGSVRWERVAEVVVYLRYTKPFHIGGQIH